MRLTWAITGVVMLAAVAGVRAQAPPASQGTVSRDEYDKLKREQDELKKEIDELKAARNAPLAPAAAQPPAAPPPAARAPSAEDFEDMQKEINDLKSELHSVTPGISNLHIGGDMSTGFTLVQHGPPSTFDAGIAPLILYQPIPSVLIEAAADIGVSTDDQNNSETSFDLTIANVSFLVNDNLAVGAGLFVVPFGVYHNHFDPPWINKFPDDPFAFSDGGIAPSSEVGMFARGAVPYRSMKFTYDAFVTNGPNLYTNADNAGSLNFEDFTDLNDNKAVGGRLGFLPFPNIEMGYSLEYANISPPDFENVNALLQAFDLNWRQEVKRIGGMLDFRTEWVMSDVGQATYGGPGTGFGPVTFENYRQGGYVQLCYRPTLSDNKYIRNVEFVSRYDWLINPLNAPGGDHEKRATLGVDYWVTPAIVVKCAYEMQNNEVNPNQNAFLVQVGIGM